MWQDALRIAKEYLPNKLAELEAEYDQVEYCRFPLIDHPSPQIVAGRRTHPPKQLEPPGGSTYYEEIR